MRLKTYLSSSQQLNRTFELAVNKPTILLDCKEVSNNTHGLRLGFIRRNHRLFLVNDFTVCVPMGGSPPRYLVSAVSSKGYQVCEYLMLCKSPLKDEFSWGDFALYPNHDMYDGIPDVELIELPDDLVDKQLTDPGVRSYIDVLRARRGS